MNLDITSDRVSKLLTHILGTTVNVTELGQAPQFAAETSIAAVYTNSEGGIVAIMLADLSMADMCGAALSLIPPSVAEKYVRMGSIDSTLLENFHEVLNICSQLFKALDGIRVSLDKVCYLHELESPAAHNLISSTVRKLNLQVLIKGYGEGNLSIFS
jgi:hypothetical protein